MAEHAVPVPAGHLTASATALISKSGEASYPVREYINQVRLN